MTCGMGDTLSGKKLREAKKCKHTSGEETHLAAHACMQRPLQPSQLVGRYALVGIGGDI